jgi:sulfur carrier protein ThiS
MNLYLGGSLAFYVPRRQTRLEIHLEAPQALGALVHMLGIPAGEIALIVVNGGLAPGLEVEIRDADEVRLYPPIGGGICAKINIRREN